MDKIEITKKRILTTRREYLFAILDKVIKGVNKHKNEPLLSDEIDRRIQRKPKSLKSDSNFLRVVAILITFSQNARSDLVKNIWENNDHFEQAFCDFDVNAVADLNPEEVIKNYWNEIKAIRFKKKIGAIIECARVIKKIGNAHGSFLQFFQKTAIPVCIKSEEDIDRFWEGFDCLLLEFKKTEMPFLGNVTTLLHMLLEMGYDCMKPDRILLKFADEVGISNKIFFVRLLQEYSLSRNMKPAVVDLYLLIYSGQLGAKYFVRSEYYKK